MTHGHGLKQRREGSMEGMGRPGRGRAEGGNWDNCNSIINKIYFKKRNLEKNIKLGKRDKSSQKRTLIEKLMIY